MRLASIGASESREDPDRARAAAASGAHLAGREGVPRLLGHLRQERGTLSTHRGYSEYSHAPPRTSAPTKSGGTNPLRQVGAGVRMHVRTYTNVCVDLYTDIYTYLNMRSCACVCVYVHVSTYVYKSMDVWMYVCTDVCRALLKVCAKSERTNERPKRAHRRKGRAAGLSRRVL